jgi:tetratricopeptide (TPR) repeat protein
MTRETFADADGQWNRMSTLFEAVLSLPSEERAAFLDATCGDDRALHLELASLVAAHDGAPAFLEAFHNDVIQPVLAQAQSESEPLGEASTVAPSDESDVPHHQRIRHFTVHERLGSGGSGVVYRGRDTLLSRDVAIKFLSPALSRDPAARARLVREAQAASRLEDPNVCAIHAIENTVDGGLCIVMGYCAGGTLRDRLRRGAIPVEDIGGIIVQLARGLASAHRAGIVHGDIKPANVGFGESDVVRLLDFGVAVHAHDAIGGGRLSGTLPYLAPELWRGGVRSTRTDVWALGVTCFEMVTGARPFPGAEPSALADGILSAQVPALLRADGANVDPTLAHLIQRMLHTNPDERPADGMAVLAALTAPRAVDDRIAPVPAVAHADTTSARTQTPWLRRGGIAALSALVAIAAWSSRPSAPARVAPAVEVARSGTPLSSIAVLPFTTRGTADISYLANGIVDLLTPGFDATGLVRGIDPNTVIGAAGDRALASLDSAASQSLAVRVRADRYVVGSVVSTGSTLTFRATLRRIDGREVGRAQSIVTDSAGLASGVESLVRQLIATELLAPGDTVAGIAAATTTSSRALRAYLDGERELRDARPAAAVAQFQAAVAADSMFALAWYRLARAARWSDVDSLSALAAHRALLLAASLPPRQQSLVRAYHTSRFGSARQAERQLQQIVADYPTDVEAWMLLGELQFGSNPYYGRPIDEAGAAFRKVMALDPRNREVTVYLMDLAAAARMTPKLDTLFSMYFSPNSAGEQPGIRATYSALYGRRVAGAVRQRGWPTPLDDPALALVALHRISSDAADRAAARSFAAAVAAASASRLEGLLALATLDVADGSWTRASAHLASAAVLDSGAAAEHRAVLALSPAVRVSDDTLRDVRRALLTRRSSGAVNADDLSHNEHEDVRSYLAGLLSVRLRDSVGVVSARESLERHGGSGSRLAAPLIESLAGHWHVHRGNFVNAALAFENAIPDLPTQLRVRYPALGQHQDRLARAAVLHRLGRRADAVRWYGSLREGSGVAGAPFVAAADSGLTALRR